MLLKYSGVDLDKLFPNLSLILSGAKDLNSENITQQISKELEECVDWMKMLSKLRDRKDYRWNQTGVVGISHYQSVDNMLGLALITWNLSKGDQKKKAEKIVKIWSEKLKVLNQNKNISESIRLWNNGRVKNIITGIRMGEA